MHGMATLVRKTYARLGIQKRSKFLGLTANPVLDAIGEAVETEAKRIKRAVRVILAGRNIPPEVLDQLYLAIDGEE